MRQAGGESMLKIDDNIGALVAAETKDTLKAIDEAILSELRLCTTLVEAFEETSLPVGSSQKLLQSLTTGLNHIVAGRSEMATAIRALTAIKSGSNLRETGYNCPSDQPYARASGQATVQPCPAAAIGG
jgi:hypothetical protein